MRIFVAGATGVIGRPLLGYLIAEGHHVLAMTRSHERAAALQAAGVEPVVCDAFDEVALREALLASRPSIVINQLTNIPKRINPRRVMRDMAATNRLRAEVTSVLVDAAAAAGARRFISQSIAFVYRPGQTTPAEEEEPLFCDAPRAFAGIVQAVEQGERAVLNASLEGIVLRYGFFYGSGTIYARDGTFADDVRKRRIPIVRPGSGTFSFIHVDDAASATVAATRYGRPGIYNIVDDDPATVRIWLPLYAAALGAPKPFTVPRALARLGAGAYGVYMMIHQRGASNAKAKQGLGWRPAVRSWRDGFVREAAI